MPSVVWVLVLLVINCSKGEADIGMRVFETENQCEEARSDLILDRTNLGNFVHCKKASVGFPTNEVNN